MSDRRTVGRVRMLYFSHQTLQVPRVARQCMVALCDGVTESGVETEIVSFRLRMHPSEPEHAPFRELYGVRGPLRHTPYRIPFAKVDTESAPFRVARLLLYGWHLLRRAIDARRYDVTIVTARNYSVLLLLVWLTKLLPGRWAVLGDVHGMPASTMGKRALARVDGNVCISRALAEDLVRELSLDPGTVTAAHSGVRPERYEAGREDRLGARRRLGLPIEGRIVAYTGKVYHRYEEIAYLVEAAERLPDDATMLIVGGRPDHVARWQDEVRRRGTRRIEFRSFVPPSSIPDYLAAADLLVLYYSPSSLNDYRSPGKLFDYLAAGRCIVASRFRSIEEVLEHGVNGLLVEPYRPELLARAIASALEDPEALKRMGGRAAVTAERYRWSERGRAFIRLGVRLAALPHIIIEPVESHA